MTSFPDSQYRNLMVSPTSRSPNPNGHLDSVKSMDGRGLVFYQVIGGNGLTGYWRSDGWRQPSKGRQKSRAIFRLLQGRLRAQLQTARQPNGLWRPTSRYLHGFPTPRVICTTRPSIHECPISSLHGASQNSVTSRYERVYKNSS